MSRMQDKSKCPNTTYAGIDVSKRHLDVCIQPSNTHFHCHNDPAGIQKLTAQCFPHGVKLVALETTPLSQKIGAGGQQECKLLFIHR